MKEIDPFSSLNTAYNLCKINSKVEKEKIWWMTQQYYYVYSIFATLLIFTNKICYNEQLNMQRNMLRNLQMQWKLQQGRFVKYITTWNYLLLYINGIIK